VLASCIAASAADIQLLGETAGQRTLKLVQPARPVRPEARALADVGGVNIHAEVAIGVPSVPLTPSQAARVRE
jgi:hypothetical protein